MDTKDQAADIFTKTLQPQKWGAALDLLGMRTDLPVELSLLSKSKGKHPIRPKAIMACV